MAMMPFHHGRRAQRARRPAPIVQAETVISPPMSGDRAPTLYDPRIGSNLLPDFTPFLTVHVGTEDYITEFFVYEEIASKQSGFFRACMANNLQEQVTRVIKLPEDDPIIFRIWLTFLMHRRIVTFDYEHPSEITSLSQIGLAVNPNDNHNEWEDLAKSYILGDKFDDTAFKDAIMDCFNAKSSEIVKGSRYYPVGSITSLVYQNTTHGSPLRRLMVDQHMAHADSSWLRNLEQPAEHEFIMDLATAFMDARRPNNAEWPDEGGERCKYHCHDKVGHVCYRLDPRNRSEDVERSRLMYRNMRGN